MKIEDEIRELARSSYWQEIYNASKNGSNIQLFKNTSNFSGIQYLFLYWARVYSMLYEELYSMEWKNLDEEVINDNTRCSAFLYYRRKKQEEELRKAKRKNKGKDKPNMMKVFTGAKNLKEGKNSV